MTALARLIGDDPGLVAVLTQVERLLRRYAESGRLPPVLILGENGTGKGLLARGIHDGSPRAGGPFVVVDCKTIPETLLESELFGFERGAFTDAREAKAGLFQTAHRGTLFLDEIGLLPEALQTKLLTVVEDRMVRRLGSTRAEPVDVSIISATSEDLKPGSTRRGFREDLFHRLAVLTLRLPPLRERGQDILTLAAHYLARSCADYGLSPKSLGDDARSRLLEHRWPGNVRELANAMERVALFSEAAVVTAAMLDLVPSGARRSPARAGRDSTATAPAPSAVLEHTVGHAERTRILEVLRATGGNISHAAARLDLTRNTLRYRLQRYWPAGWRGETARAAPADPAPLAVDAVSAPATVKVQWERRHIALLRVELDGAGAPSRRDAARGLEQVIEKVHGFGGQIDALSPAGLVAAFGLEAVEDAGRRAAHAALAIRNLAARNDDGAPAFVDLRIGLHVADALIAPVGGALRIDHDAKRQAWTELDELLARAEPGAVLMSEATRPFLERRFVVAPSRTRDGSTGRGYRLVSLARTGLPSGEQPTPFVARGDELERLADALEHTADGHGQVVGVVGEAGVGKSRLVWEFGESLRLQNARLLVTGAASHAQATSCLPVADLLRAYFQIESRDDGGQVHARVRTRIGALGPALEPALPALLALLDVPSGDPQWRDLDPRERQRRTLEAVRLLLVEESRLQPVVVVFEDLHWIDSQTQAVLDTLVESVPGQRLLLLVSYRPEYRHAWSNKSYYVPLRLDPLSAENVRVLLENLVGRAAATALEPLLLERTDGNPFFLEESVHALVETGVLVGQRGDYRLARAADEIQVPATVQAVLAARVERLPPEDKALLQTAAVIGRDVPFDLLQTVAGVPGDSLRAALVRLRGSELLYAARLLPQLEYAFKHSLSHEAAYAAVLEDRRQTLHARTMQAIEALYANRLTEHVERLAHHALRGAVWDKTAAYARQAGAKAAARSANREAAACFEQALGGLRHLPESRETIEQDIDLRVDLYNVLHPLGERRRGVGHLQEAEILAERIGDQRRLGWISVSLAHHFWVESDLDRAVESGRRALAAAAAHGDVGLQIVADLRLGEAYHAMGEYDRSNECLRSNIDSLRGEQIRERFGEAGLPSVLSRAFLVRTLAERGEFSAALPMVEDAVRIAETAQHPFSLQVAYFYSGFLYLRKGDLDDAIRFLERGRDLGRARGLRTVFGIDQHLGHAYVLAGRVDEGLSLLEEAIEQASSMGGVVNARALPLVYLSEAHLRADRPQHAIRLADEARAFTHDHKRRGQEAWALRAVAEAAMAASPPDTEKSADAYRQAMVLADERGMRPLLAHCHLGLGRLYRRLGKQQQAREHLTAAAAMYRAMEMPLWLAQAEAEIRTTA